MATPKLGINRVKEGLSLVFSFWKQTKEALSDGKFNWLDAMGYLDEILSVPGIVATSKELFAQSLDLDTTERTEIEVWAATQFPNETPENVKKKVTAGIDWLITTMIAYATFAKTSVNDDTK